MNISVKSVIKSLNISFWEVVMILPARNVRERKLVVCCRLVGLGATAALIFLLQQAVLRAAQGVVVITAALVIRSRGEILDLSRKARLLGERQVSCIG
jgi:hypothetical protein